MCMLLCLCVCGGEWHLGIYICVSEMLLTVFTELKGLHGERDEGLRFHHVSERSTIRQFEFSVSVHSSFTA